ncbi:MAG TPA: aldehyde dehydrogenase family protein [candidate division Zixibacteria bacterium]|nr:aldehyde dehydrogenase family protein [candidate division Zixibacteria bacterium]
MERYPLLIGNEEVFTSETMVVRSPFDGAEVGEVCIAGKDEIEKAIASAHLVFPRFARTDTKFRVEILNKAEELLGERAEEFARMISAEAGKPIREARGEVSRARETLRLSAIAASEHMGGKVLTLDSASNGRDKWGFCQRFPAGPVLAITPFNFPLNLAVHKIGPAIAVGNPFILKPAEQTPITAIMLGQLLVEAGMPKGTVSVLNGLGPSVGQPIAEDDRIKVVTFTGSPEVGLLLSRVCGMKLTAFELGSNSAVYVHHDADIMRAADRIVAGGFVMAGQVCISTQRVYAHREVYAQLIDLILIGIRVLKLGDPSDEMTNVGPMIDEQAALRAENWLNSAIERGAKILIGGNRNGTLFEPTLVADVPDYCELLREEIFAPIIVIEEVPDEGEAIARINDSKYGLHAGIFTQDINLARTAFEKIEAGGVIINDVPTFRADLMPYGGVKLSGIGREGPEFAIEHMTYWKNFVVHGGEKE